MVELNTRRALASDETIEQRLAILGDARQVRGGAISGSRMEGRRTW
jgi:hypothetical protein